MDEGSWFVCGQKSSAEKVLISVGGRDENLTGSPVRLGRRAWATPGPDAHHGPHCYVDEAERTITRTDWEVHHPSCDPKNPDADSAAPCSIGMNHTQLRAVLTTWTASGANKTITLLPSRTPWLSTALHENIALRSRANFRVKQPGGVGVLDGVERGVPVVFTGFAARRVFQAL